MRRLTPFLHFHWFPIKTCGVSHIAGLSCLFQAGIRVEQVGLLGTDAFKGFWTQHPSLWIDVILTHFEVPKSHPNIRRPFFL